MAEERSECSEDDESCLERRAECNESPEECEREDRSDCEDSDCESRESLTKSEKEELREDLDIASCEDLCGKGRKA